MQRIRQTLSREERELHDVERQMEEQLVQDHMELERVVTIRSQKGAIGYLCKWKGLPYSEATWEPVEIIQEAKASDKVDSFQACLQLRSQAIQERQLFALLSTPLQTAFTLGGLACTTGKCR